MRPYVIHNTVKIGLALSYYVLCGIHVYAIVCFKLNLLIHVQCGNLQHLKYHTLFPGFPLVPAGPCNPWGPYIIKGEEKTNWNIYNTKAGGQKEMYSCEGKIVSGLTGRPLSPMSPLSPVGPGTPCKIKTSIHLGIITRAIQLLTQIHHKTNTIGVRQNVVNLFVVYFCNPARISQAIWTSWTCIFMRLRLKGESRSWCLVSLNVKLRLTVAGALVPHQWAWSPG